MHRHVSVNKLPAAATTAAAVTVVTATTRWSHSSPSTATPGICWSNHQDFVNIGSTVITHWFTFASFQNRGDQGHFQRGRKLAFLQREINNRWERYCYTVHTFLQCVQSNLWPCLAPAAPASSSFLFFFFSLWVWCLNSESCIYCWMFTVSDYLCSVYCIFPLKMLFICFPVKLLLCYWWCWWCIY